MGISSTFSGSGDFHLLSLVLALIATLVCCYVSHFALRLLQRDKAKACNCTCSDSNETGGDTDSMAAATESPMYGGDAAEAERERQQMIGASIMEQLVPEITTHALSYLDYVSLCRLSMTNSSMRRAANDDNAWKALYRKDFTMEQDSIRPSNGWKAYYAATRAIMNSNRQFFNVIRERSLPEMGRVWLNADYVKCVHASGELFTGYRDVTRSWQMVFNWEPGFDFQVRDAIARVAGDVAWVNMKAGVDVGHDVLNVTNVFEFHNGQWYMVHHHSSLIVPEQDLA